MADTEPESDPESDSDPESAPESTGPSGAFSVLRRGVAESPELRVGLGSTVLLALIVAVGRLVVPVLIQQILDSGITGSDGLRPRFVVASCAIAVIILGVVAVTNRAAYLRLVTAAENTLYGLRTRTFDHVHRLSIAHHNESKRGLLVTRVTSDIETLAQFAQWGAISWIVNSVLIVGVFATMAVYSWQIAILTMVIFAPVIPLLRVVQRHQIQAYDHLRTTVGETQTEISEVVMGAPVVRAYGMGRRMRTKLHRAIARQYKAQMRAAWYFALMFPVSDIFGAIALGSVIGVGVWWGPGWGLDPGSLVALVFLTTLVLQPIGEIGEILDQTQNAIAGWRKVLDLLDVPVDVVEPTNGAVLAQGPLSLSVDAVGFHYIPGTPVLSDVSLDVPAGTNVAIVGETGSGKTTLASLLCRLADPTSGTIEIGGIPLETVDPDSRHERIRMVPQDGFLFDATIFENIEMGAPGCNTHDIDAAVGELGLQWWVDSLPAGLDGGTGERGSELSVGERQLVALVRAQLADPGLLILDEATSAVDPETERALSDALVHLAEGRTTVTIAHRLSTAESADMVVVFDGGRVAEVGSHEELVARGGVYSALHDSWVGNTRRASAGEVPA